MGRLVGCRSSIDSARQAARALGSWGHPYVTVKNLARIIKSFDRTLDEPTDPKARFCPPDLVPVFGDGIHDGEDIEADDNAASTYLSYEERHPDGSIPRRHVKGFWTLDDPDDPNARRCPADLVPTPGDGVHDGQSDDDFTYSTLPDANRGWKLPIRRPGALHGPKTEPKDE
jgi:hypothetical protein